MTRIEISLAILSGGLFIFGIYSESKYEKLLNKYIRLKKGKKE